MATIDLLDKCTVRQRAVRTAHASHLQAISPLCWWRKGRIHNLTDRPALPFSSCRGKLGTAQDDAG